jgi:predicted TIM-barrel fold metal-dependent hydrolase
MIVDVHTHVFPPHMIAERARLAAADAGFGVLYGSPRARMATAEELLASMDNARIDRAVACGFWWRFPEQAQEHRAYLLEAASRSGGRIVPFVPVAIGEVVAEVSSLAGSGVAGLGEVRTPDDAPELAADLDALLGAAIAQGLPLLAHCSEEVGHAYPGKGGGLTTGALWRLLSAHPRARVIAAHWGGGFPFYALMPEVSTLLAEGRLVFDTAASPLLYDARVFEAAHSLLGDGLVLWGSDFPLRDQAADRAAVEAAVHDEAQRAAVLGGNAARFLGLS